MGISGKDAVVRFEAVSFGTGAGGTEVFAPLDVSAPMVFEPRFEVQCPDRAGPVAGPWGDFGWLRRGRYQVRTAIPPHATAGTPVELRVLHKSGLQQHVGASSRAEVPAGHGGV